jgi:hypothetical protein
MTEWAYFISKWNKNIFRKYQRGDPYIFCPVLAPTKGGKPEWIPHGWLLSSNFRIYWIFFNSDEFWTKNIKDRTNLT